MPISYPPVTAASGTNSLAPTFAPSNANSTVGFSQTLYAGLYNATAAYTITKCDILLPTIQSGSTIAIGLYDWSTNALLTSGTGTTTATPGWLTVTLSSFAIAAGRKCWYGVLNQTSEATTQFASVSNANNVFYTFNLTGQTVLPAPMPTAGRNSTNQVPCLMFY